MIELLILAAIPVFILIWYIYKKDKFEPEPPYLVARVFLYGMLAVIPIIILEIPFGQGFLLLVVGAPIVEEILKFCVVYYSVFKTSEFNEPMDGIVYAAAAGLGFALVENVLFVVQGGFSVGIARAIASVPGHLIFSCIWGYALGIAKFSPKEGREKIIQYGLLFAILLHSLFNFSITVFGTNGYFFILLVLIPFGWWKLHGNINSAQNHLYSAQSIHGSGISVQEKQGIQDEPSNTAQQIDDTVILKKDELPIDSQKEDNIQDINLIGGYCSQCGKPHRSGAKYCVECGSSLSQN